MMRDFLLGTDATTDKAVTLSFANRDLGTLILGGTGMGKSTLLLRLLEHDWKTGTSAIVLDPHGDLIDDYLHHISFGLASRVFVVETNEEFPYTLNLYECADTSSIRAVDRVVNNVVNTFGKLFGDEREYKPNIEFCVRNTARTIIPNHLTMAEIPFLFGSAAYRSELLQNVKNPQVFEFWHHWESLTRSGKAQLAQPLLVRLDKFLGEEWLYRIVSGRHTTIPFQKILQEGGTLLLKLPREDEELTNFLGTLFVALLSQAVWQQGELPPGERKRVHLYLDEYGRYASQTSAMLLKECRKLNIGTTIAHQTLSDVGDEENRKAELQVGNLIFFQVEGEDSEVLVKNLKLPEEKPKVDPRVIQLTQDPMGYLLTNGHKDPHVQVFILYYLKPLDEILQLRKAFLTASTTQERRDTSFNQPIGRDCYYYPFLDTLQASLQVNDETIWISQEGYFLHMKECVNKFLYECMEMPNKPLTWSPPSNAYYKVLPILYGFHALIKVWMPFNEQDHISLRDMRSLIPFLPLSEAIFKEIWQPLYHPRVAQATKDALLSKMAFNLYSFFKWLSDAALALQQNPIYVPTGAIDITLLNQAALSVSDQRLKLAHRLATLPRYHAYCQSYQTKDDLYQGEVILKDADDPNNLSRSLLKQISTEYLILRNQQDITIPWCKLERDIQERQKLIQKTLQATPPKTETPLEPEAHPLQSRSQIFYPQ